MTILLQVMEWIHTYQSEVFAGAFFGVQAVVFISLMVVSRKLTKTRKMINKMADQIVDRMEKRLKPVVEQKADSTTEKHIVNVTENHQKDEEENRVISSVLKEIFP